MRNEGPLAVRDEAFAFHTFPGPLVLSSTPSRRLTSSLILSINASPCFAYFLLLILSHVSFIGPRARATLMRSVSREIYGFRCNLRYRSERCVYWVYVLVWDYRLSRVILASWVAFVVKVVIWDYEILVFLEGQSQSYGI